MRQLLQNEGADANEETAVRSSGYAQNAASVVTPLIVACKLGDMIIVQMLLAHGARTVTQGAAGEQALHAAASCGYTQICKLLLAHEATRPRHGATTTRD